MRSKILIVLTAILLFLPVVSFCQFATVGYIYNHTLTSASTEYKVTLGQGIKAFSVQLRGAYDLRLAFTAGGTATSYMTIKADGQAVYYSPIIGWDGNLYLRCEQAGQVAEVEYWR